MVALPFRHRAATICKFNIIRYTSPSPPVVDSRARANTFPLRPRSVGAGAISIQFSKNTSCRCWPLGAQLCKNQVIWRSGDPVTSAPTHQNRVRRGPRWSEHQPQHLTYNSRIAWRELFGKSLLSQYCQSDSIFAGFNAGMATARRVARLRVNIASRALPRCCRTLQHRHQLG